jgi:hypothetical protein
VAAFWWFWCFVHCTAPRHLTFIVLAFVRLVHAQQKEDSKRRQRALAHDAAAELGLVVEATATSTSSMDGKSSASGDGDGDGNGSKQSLVSQLLDARVCTVQEITGNKCRCRCRRNPPQKKHKKATCFDFNFFLMHSMRLFGEPKRNAGQRGEHSAPSGLQGTTGTSEWETE